MPDAVPLSDQCLVCGLPLSGVAGTILSWIGIDRSSRNPNCCTRCNTHIEEGRLVEITTVFADLSSFTEITNALGADATFELTDQYLRLAATVLTSHGAYIDKYIGDAVMAFFNIPVKQEDHAQVAVAAAKEILERLPELSERTGVRLQASIGIATGFARLGRLGSDDVKDFTAVGAVVNQAARLQSQARAGEIVVSQDLYSRISADYPDLPMERLTLRGFQEEIGCYRIRGESQASTRVSRSALLESEPLGAGAFVTALLGAGCLGSSMLGAVSMLLGTGSILTSAALWLDHSPLRRPLLVAAVGLATLGLWTLAKNKRLRREYSAEHACVIDTPKEVRRDRLIAWLCVIALAAATGEFVMHYLKNGSL